MPGESKKTGQELSDTLGYSVVAVVDMKLHVGGDKLQIKEVLKGGREMGYVMQIAKIAFKGQFIVIKSS